MFLSRTIIATNWLVTDDHRYKLSFHGRSLLQIGLSRKVIAANCLVTDDHRYKLSVTDDHRCKMSCHGRSSLQIVFSRAIIATACLVTDDHRCKMFCHGRSSVQLGVSRTFIATFRRFSFLFFPLPPSYFFFFCFSLSFSFISPPLFSTDLFALSVPFCNSTRPQSYSIGANQKMVITLAVLQCSSSHHLSLSPGSPVLFLDSLLPSRVTITSVRERESLARFQLLI